MNSITTMGRQSAVPENPLVKKLWAVECAEDTTATYRGIYAKCLFFLAMTVAGVLLTALFSAAGAIAVDPAAGEIFVDRTVVILLLVAAAMLLIFPFIAFLVRVTIPVTGLLYCACIGFLFSFFAALDAEMGSCILLALALTLAVVAVMGFLFYKGYIRVSAKLRAVLSTFFIASIVGSLLLLLCCFVPPLRSCVLFLTTNPLLYTIGSATGMVAAILFLLVDFDTIQSVAENQLPKEYEWYASFSLAFTVIWVYLKILHLVLRFKDRR